MKKVIYVVVVLVVLLGLSMLLKNNQPTTDSVEAPVAVEEVAVAETPSAGVAEGEVVVVDEEPAVEGVAEANTAEITGVEEVVEENPETTADEGETVVEE